MHIFNAAAALSLYMRLKAGLRSLGPALLAPALLGLVAACNADQGPAKTAPDTIQGADMIFSGGPIYTSIDAQPSVEAVAVRGNQIIAAGTLDLLERYRTDTTTMIDLAGAAMYPGFTDAHAHLIGIGFRELTLNLEGTPSVAALVEIVRTEVARLEPGQTLYGRGWIETGWPEGRFPGRADLDPVSPHNPVILERADGHAMVVNSAALARAAITPETADPAGGRIEKDAAGKPTGMLIDAAQTLVAPLIAAPTKARKREAYETASRIYAARGWTGLHNMSVNPANLEIIDSLASQTNGDGVSRLAIRVYNSLEPEGLALLEREGHRIDATGRIITRAIKLYADGALGSRGAALFAPYSDQQDTHGLVLIEPDKAIAHYRRALAANIQVNTHAIGDRGNALVLDWYEAAYKAWAKDELALTGPRFRIEHSQIVRPDDIVRFKRNAIIASMQPSHAIGDLHFAPSRLGPDRLDGAYAWRSMIDAGVIIAAGSDAPVERGDPRIEFYAAIARRDLTGFQGDGWHPQQVVSRQEALKMLTVWPAYAAFQEQKLGTIEAGKRADFTVFSRDIMKIPPADILTVQTVMTIVDGQMIFDARN